MKRKVFLMLAVAVLCSCRKSGVVAAPVSARSTGSESGAAHGEAVPEAASVPEPEANPRTRPSLPPVEREYAKPKPQEIPVAAALEGKPGFVTSPYNGKIIDVNGIPAGTLVADPTFPTEEKKFFRVPE